jgi:hypothetical protein
VTKTEEIRLCLSDVFGELQFWEGRQLLHCKSSIVWLQLDGSKEISECDIQGGSIAKDRLESTRVSKNQIQFFG